MPDDRPVLLCFDGSPDAGRAIGAAAVLFGVRSAVVLTVWEPARDLTPLNPVGDAVGRLSGLYADVDEAGLELARETAATGAESRRDTASPPARGSAAGRRPSRSSGWPSSSTPSPSCSARAGAR